MDHDPIEERRRRETFLTILLTLVGGSVFVFFLVLVSGGFLLWAVVGGVALLVLGLFHYTLWGYGMSRATEGEREEAQVQAKLAPDEWELPEAQRPRHD